MCVSVLALGCARASVFPVSGEPPGSYLLVSSAANLEKAMIRIDRSARHVCGARPYDLTAPEIVDESWHVSPSFGGGDRSGMFAIQGGAGKLFTVQARLRCR